jgi:hypothetical protein
LRIALQSALGRHAYSIQLGDLAEVLEQRAIGQAERKAAKVFHDQRAQDITAQSTAGVPLNCALGFGGDVFALGASLPALESVGHELRFQSAEEEQLIDAQELLA